MHRYRRRYASIIVGMNCVQGSDSVDFRFCFGMNPYALPVFFMMLSVLGGCKHADQKAPLPGLITINGTAENVANASVHEHPLRVAVNWHIKSPEGFSDRHYAAEHIGFVDSSSSFSLTLRSPPPERSRIPADTLDIEGDPNAW